MEQIVYWSHPSGTYHAVLIDHDQTICILSGVMSRVMGVQGNVMVGSASISFEQARALGFIVKHLERQAG